MDDLEYLQQEYGLSDEQIEKIKECELNGHHITGTLIRIFSCMNKNKYLLHDLNEPHEILKEKRRRMYYRRYTRHSKERK